MTHPSSCRSAGWQIWIDRGGTFTDLVARDPDGRLRMLKLLSENPAQYEDAAVEGVRRLLGLSPGEPVPASLKVVKMGTTVATNALLERRGEPVLLVTNEGLGDALVIAAQNRPDLFALDIRRPSPLHAEVLEVAARMGADGVEVRPLDTDRIRRDLAAAHARGLRACALVLIHSWANPAQENTLAKLAREVGFVQVSVSHRISPLMRMIGRGDTTVADAYLSPVVRRYADTLARELAPARLMFMQSHGGLTDAARFRGRDAVLSGPAGGIVGAARTAEAAGFSRLVTFDMGGTSTDVAHVDGAYERSLETDIAGVRIRAPMMRIHTVAAGGGSILHLQDGRFQVGPDSAGADPGPACYRKGGPLTVTDANLLLGRIREEAFPAIFGPKADQPLDREGVVEGFAGLAARVREEAGRAMSPEAVADGFLTVAVDNMARAIRGISTQRGIDIAGHTLVAFGGAGGQHACRLADSLGMRRIFLHPLAGVLSALGMGLADLRELRSAAVEMPLDGIDDAQLLHRVAALGGAASAALETQGVQNDRITLRAHAFLRYRGTDTALMVPFGTSRTMAEAFAEAHRERFGFVTPEVPLLCESVQMEAIGATGVDPVSLSSGDDGPGPILPAGLDQAEMWIGGSWHTVPLVSRAALRPGESLEGPAILFEDGATTVIDPGWRAQFCSGNEDVQGKAVPGLGLLLSRTAPPPSPRAAARGPDPVMLELFGNRMMAIAEEMGAALVNTAHSVNIKERLDFSCAVFDGAGQLVANAPHVPVHLGSMGDAVAAVMHEAARSASSHDAGDATGPRHGFADGDVFIHNDPYSGGTHLPDVTLVRPVFAGADRPTFFVAARGHHADIGGTHPGSVPPLSTSIEEEGIRFRAAPLVVEGRFREDWLRARLAEGPWPARLADQNVADLKAQAAACARGAAALEALARQHGPAEVVAAMGHLQDNAEAAVRRVIGRLKDGAFRVAMDDGEEVAVAVTIDRRRRLARVDFRGTSGPSPTNLNAPRSVCRAAVLYVFRTLVAAPIPMNAGCLRPIELIVPEDSLLSPKAPAAVVGGNVETAQILVDALLAALGCEAASQGTMNNLTFGDAGLQYYETIGGGSGAGPGFHGASAVHSHMTNARLTDPEVLEWRFPVRLERLAIRTGSGGAGRWCGGDGMIREIRFLAPMRAAILSGRRRLAPFGLAGGEPGQPGLNTVIRADGRVETLGPRAETEMAPGDRLRIETPGGGGYGAVPIKEKGDS